MSLKVNFEGVPEMPKDLALALFKFSLDLEEAGFTDRRQSLTMYLGCHTVQFISTAGGKVTDDRPMVTCPECKTPVTLAGYESHLHDHAVLRGAK